MNLRMLISSMDLTQIVFNIAQSLPGFLLAIVVHEAAHGYVAYKFGDDTAMAAGRVSLNPAVHYDPFGTVLFPLIGAFMGWAIIGWAKPVPVDARRFSNFKKGLFWVSFAGPLSNFILGTISAFIYALVYTYVDKDFSYYSIMLQMISYSVLINFILGAFNLIPLPPLDGSKMVASFLSYEAMRKYEEFGRYTQGIILLVFALSIMGVHILSWIFLPVQMVANYILVFFLAILS
jgi:Zn-dependent protease